MKRKSYPLLFIAPVGSLLIAILFGIAAVKFHALYALVSVFGAITSMLMFSNNIKKGWGWHGQRYPE